MSTDGIKEIAMQSNNLEIEMLNEESKTMIALKMVDALEKLYLGERNK